MRGNPRLESMWKPLVNLISIRLFSWKHRYVPIGERVILINFILNIIPIFVFFYLFLKFLLRFGKR